MRVFISTEAREQLEAAFQSGLKSYRFAEDKEKVKSLAKRICHTEKQVEVKKNLKRIR